MKVAVTTLAFCVASLLALGLVMLYSSSMVMFDKHTHSEIGAHYLMMQLVWCALRISLLLAPAAALLSTLMAALVGGLGGYLGGGWARGAMAVTDLFLSLPWLFLLITVRAVMPLNVSPLASVLVTFLMLGLLGWTSAARVLCSTAGSLRESDFVRQARASGIRGARLFWVHVLPNLKPVLYAQFWISIPAFILSEANLG